MHIKNSKIQKCQKLSKIWKSGKISKNQLKKNLKIQEEKN